MDSEINSLIEEVKALREEMVVLGTSIMVTNARMYDLLLLILQGSNGVQAERIRKMHEEGQLLCPPPAIAEDDES